MNDGTNNYGVFKLTPTDEIVSRTLQANYRNFSNVVWETGKPALDAEWNLINDMATEAVKNTIRSTTLSGWLNLGPNQNSTYSATPNTISFYAQEDLQEAMQPNVIINGWPMLVGGVNYTDTTLNIVELEAANSAERFDFVFLEVWRAQLRSRDPENVPIAQNKPSVDYIWKFGNVQYLGTNLVDDLIDPVFDEETSQRVQVQYRIRVVSDVTFTNTDSVGFDDSTVQAQGGGTSPQSSGYVFTNMASELGDAGLWRAGVGNEASQIALQSVDGYSYAIPMFKIYRRGTNVYSDTGGDTPAALYNQSGNSTIMVNLISDRPDEKFNDGIDASDIIDLRQKTSLLGWDYQKIMEHNLDKLFRGQLRTNFVQRLAYDSISDTDIYGYNDILDNAGAGAKRKIWSDALTAQYNIFAEVKISTIDTSLDVYRATGTGPWADGNSIVVKITSRLPAGSVVRATPRVYAEDQYKTNLASHGTWTGLGTVQATFTFNSSITSFDSYDLWVYYDIDIPAGQGLSYPPDELLSVTYQNASSFSNGTVIRGSIIKSKTNRFQDLFGHTYQNRDNTTTYVESETLDSRKQFKIRPMVQTTTTKNGTTRTLEVETLDHVAKTIYVPYPLQHLKGVYATLTGGTELAMRTETSQQVSAVEADTNQILVSVDYFIATITSFQYIPSGPGSEIELIGVYSPVFEHKVVTGDYVGTRVSLYNSTGEIWPIPTGALPNQFKWTGTRIRVRQGGGYGYDIEGLIIDCTDSPNAGLLSSMPDRQQLWIDCDYLGAAHAGAELRVIYSYTPYQGSDVGSQDVSFVHKRERGFFFNNGTGGGTVSSGIDGTSSLVYSPLSPRLPGSFDDFLRNGEAIEILSSGQKRFNTDLWSTASYDIYGYRNGGSLLVGDFTMPTTPETTQRGFLGSPMFEAIFEDPSVDATYAEFIMPLLVRHKTTGQLYLLIQIGNKGIHVAGEGDILIDLFHLDERILVKG